MNKSDLIGAVSRSTGLASSDSTRAVEAVFDSIAAALRSGDTVALAGFGSFLVQERAARTGRNPRTGAMLDIAASKVPKFKPGKALRDAIK
jgi:DNA-binding protein HU-beta